MSQLNEVDLAFIIDTTGSMGSFINAAREQMTNMLKSLTEQSAVPIDLRVGVVEYRDHPPQERSFVTREYEFTQHLKRVQKTINRLKPSGGGDWPEAVYDGVVSAAELLEWRPHSRRLAVLVGDAPPHGHKSPTDTCHCGLSAESSSAALEEHGIVLYALGLTNQVEESFSWLAHYTGGRYFTAQGNAAIQALQKLLADEFSELDFDQRVLEWCASQSGWTIDGLCEALESPRGRVAASLSRLGRRHLLKGLEAAF